MKRYFLIALMVCAGVVSASAWGGGRPIWTGDVAAGIFNDHLNKGIHSGITMSVELPLYAYGEEVFTLQDSIDENKIAGYVYNGYTIVDSAEIDTAVQYLSKSIKDFPDRLDLYLGLATAHLYCLNTDAMVEVLEQAMKREKKNKGKWLWEADEPVPDSLDIVYERIQEDYKRFLEADMLYEAEHLARTAMKYFPKRAEYVNDVAVVFVYRRDYQEALKWFKKALKMAPEDKMIQENIEYMKQVIE